MILKCMIVDDEPVARKVLQEYIEDIPFLELAGSVENAMKANNLLASSNIDLIFLDINMPKLSGIEFLRASENLPPVIMTTAYAEHALDGFELDVLDYLVKPIPFERFLKACNKAKEFIALKKNASDSSKPSSNYFFVKSNNRIEKIFYEDLVCVEAMLNYIILHTSNGKLIVYHTLKGVAEQLPENIFIKVHKSFIINLNKIKSIEGNEINLGSLKIAISQNLYEKTIKTILGNRMLKR